MLSLFLCTSALHKVQNKASSSLACCWLVTSSLRQSSLTRKPQKKPPIFKQEKGRCLTDFSAVFKLILLGSSREAESPDFKPKLFYYCCKKSKMKIQNSYSFTYCFQAATHDKVAYQRWAPLCGCFCPQNWATLIITIHKGHS